MGIEKDIQQPTFRNEYQKMGINIIFTVIQLLYYLVIIQPYR